MSEFFGFLCFVAMALLITGLNKPELVIRWGEKKDKKEVLKYYGTALIVFLIITAAASPVAYTVNKDVEDVTAKEAITISGEAPNDGNLFINGQKCEISKEKFNCNYPLTLGMNEFKVDFNKGSAGANSQVYSIRRTTEENLAKEKAAAEASKEQARLAAERKKTIESQFSSYDGSHRNLEQGIKKSMNDPSSYEHVETVFWDMKNHLVVRTKFRGKNAFGGLVMNTVKAKVSLDGDVFEIISQN